jgi:hypothetical protein
MHGNGGILGGGLFAPPASVIGSSGGGGLFAPPSLRTPGPGPVLDPPQQQQQQQQSSLFGSSADATAASSSASGGTKGVIQYNALGEGMPSNVHVFFFPGKYQVRLEAIDTSILRLYVTDSDGNEQGSAGILDSVKVRVASKKQGGRLRPVGSSYYMSSHEDYVVSIDNNDAILLTSRRQHTFKTAHGVSHETIML